MRKYTFLIPKRRWLHSWQLVSYLFAGLVLTVVPILDTLTTSATNALPMQTTPTVQVCGARSSADVEMYTGSTLQDPLMSQVLTSAPTGGSYRYWAPQGQTPRWYLFDMNSGQTGGTFTVYQASNYALLGTFSVTVAGTSATSPVQNGFAVDNAGNVYTISYNTSPSVQQWKWSVGQTSATLGWTASTSSLASYEAYAYTDANGMQRIGVETRNGGSDTFNAQTGAAMGHIALDGYNINTAFDHNNDLVTYDDTTIQVWNSTATTLLVNLDWGDLQVHPTSVNELADGTLMILPTSGYPLQFYSSQGMYLGNVGMDEGAGDPMEPSAFSSRLVVEGGNGYYISAADTLDQFSISAAEQYLQAPQGAPFQLGMGVNLSLVGADSDGYYSSGQTPGVNVTFAPTWQSDSANFTGQYTVRNQDQVLNNDPGTAQTFSIPSTTAAYSSGVATVPLSLPAPTPGFYEVNVQLLQSGKVVGASCQVYSIGPAGAQFTPDSYTGGTDTDGVEEAAQLGQKLYRSAYNLPDCFPGVTTPTASTTLNCSADMDSDIASAAAEAAKLGVVYEIQLGTGSGLAANAVANGQWQRLVNLMAAHYSEVKDWECWNEPDNNTFSSAANYVTSALEPCYNAVKAVSSSDMMIGISNDNHSVGNYTSYVQAGALKYLDIVAIHDYTGWNKDLTEQGEVSQPYGTSGETGSLQALQSYLTSQGYTGPIYDTESGFWNYGLQSPYGYYSQADKLITKYVLTASLGMNWHANFYNDGGYAVNGMGWGLINGTGAAPAALASINYQTELGGRSFISWIPTGVPNTYAALFGPSATSSNDIAVVWADQFSVAAVPSLSGGGSIGVTSEYGETSTVTSGQSLTLQKQVQYLTVPAGQTLSITAAEAFGSNVAAASNGATASASSSYSCGGSTVTNASNVLQGITDDQGSNWLCDGQHVWSTATSDANPTITVTLPTAQSVDRVYVSTYSIGSSLISLRNYDLQVSTDGTNFTTVASVVNNFFNRNQLLTFPSQTVKAIRITNMAVNWSGVGDGLKPLTWPNSYDVTTPIYAIEAYAPGPSAPSLPTVTIPALAAQNVIRAAVISFVPTIDPGGGATVTKVQAFVDGTSIGTSTTSPYNFSISPLNYANGAHTLVVQVTNSAGLTSSATANFTLLNADFNGDNQVNISDLVILANNYGKSVSGYANGDINGDGVVNLTDLVGLSKYYGYKE